MIELKKNTQKILLIKRHLTVSEQILGKFVRKLRPYFKVQPSKCIARSYVFL